MTLITYRSTDVNGGRPQRRMEAHPRVLEGTHAGQPQRDPHPAPARDNRLAIHAWSRQPVAGLARRLHALQPLPGPARRGRGSAGSLSRLRQQHRPVSPVPGLLPDPPAATAGHLGPQRPVFPAGRSRSLQTRHPRRRCPAARHRPLRARDERGRDRHRHPRVPHRLNAVIQRPPRVWEQRLAENPEIAQDLMKVNAYG